MLVSGRVIGCFFHTEIGGDSILVYFRVVDLALNQAAKPWKPIFRSIGTIGGFVSEDV